jgi:hypothetical protein
MGTLRRLCVAVVATVACSVGVAQAAPNGYQSCPQGGAAGAFVLSVRNMKCSSAVHILEGGLEAHHNLRRGHFRCHRERNAENVLWVYFCHNSYHKLFFDTY